MTLQPYTDDEENLVVPFVSTSFEEVHLVRPYLPCSWLDSVKYGLSALAITSYGHT